MDGFTVRFGLDTNRETLRRRVLSQRRRWAHAGGLRLPRKRRKALYRDIDTLARRTGWLPRQGWSMASIKAEAHRMAVTGAYWRRRVVNRLCPRGVA